MKRLLKPLQHLTSSEHGQDVAEYALLLALLVFVVVFGVGILGNTLFQYWIGAVAQYVANVAV